MQLFAFPVEGAALFKGLVPDRILEQQAYATLYIDNFCLHWVPAAYVKCLMKRNVTTLVMLNKWLWWLKRSAIPAPWRLKWEDFGEFEAS